MSSQTIARSSISAGALLPWRGRAAVLREKLRVARRAVETRRELEELDAHVLADIGVSHTEAVQEARRAPWDLDPVLPRLTRNFGGRGIVMRQPAGCSVTSPDPANARWSGRRPGDGRSQWDGAREHWQAFRQSVAEALRRRRSRQAIADLDEFLLKDVGVSRAEAENEANKPFWR